MKNRLRSALACFILSFFAYFRYLLAVSAVTAAAYAFGHQLFGPFLPGIGLTVSHWILVISALLYARAKGRLQFRHRGPAILLLALAVMLSACYGIFANNRLRWMNLPALFSI